MTTQELYGSLAAIVPMITIYDLRNNPRVMTVMGYSIKCSFVLLGFYLILYSFYEIIQQP